jgi:hypothetical protein
MVNGTTLAAPVDANGLDINVVSTTGASKDRICKIEDEYSVVVKVLGNIVSLRTRGDQGTVSRAHSIMAPVAFGDAIDFETLPPARHHGQIEQSDGYYTYGTSGAIAIPERDSTIVLAGTAVLAMTIPDPTRLQEGRKLTIAQSAAAAHTVTCATGFGSGGGTLDIATFAAIGDNMVIQAINGKWAVLSLKGVTLA